MSLSIRWKVAVGSLASVMCGLAVAGLLAVQSLEQQEVAQLSELLEARTTLTAYGLTHALQISSTALDLPQARRTVRELSTKASARITLVGTDGTVLADSAVADAELHTVDNHRSRPEIQQALATGYGSDIRASHTTGIRTMYRATSTNLRHDGKPVLLRMGLPMTLLEQETAKLQRNLAIAFSAALLVAILLSLWLARSITKPLSDIAAELRRLETIRKDFVANVSHELRTPLTSIKGYVEALLDGGKDDPGTADQFLGIILKQTDRLNLILEDLLELSKIESGRVSFKDEPVDLNTLIDRALATVRPLAEKKGHRLLAMLDPSLPAIAGDADRLMQVLTNLLDNAVKYTPDGGTITVAAGAGPEQSLLLSVTDTGIGIPEEDRPRIFERFYRVDKARSRDLGGTGLGLSIVKHIVEGHGGQVWVEGNQPRGSRFIVRLPGCAPVRTTAHTTEVRIA